MNFFEVDDWNEIVPLEINRYSGKELKTLVSNYFNRYLFKLQGKENAKRINNLLFALVEFSSVNIDNLNGVGATYIYCDAPENNAKMTLEKYVEYLDEIRKSNKRLITEFTAWYDSPAYILQLENSSKGIVELNSQQLWFAEQGDTHEKSIENKGEPYPDGGFEKYLTNYAFEMVPKLQLDKYPYAFIVAKPVSLPDWKGENKPIGNYFIHIGLKEKINKTQIVNFIHLFHLTWFKNYWNTIFKSLNENIVQEDTFDYSRYYLRINLSEKGNIIHIIKPAKDININLYVRKFFRSNQSFEDELKNTIYPKIVRSLFELKSKQNRDSWDFINYIDITNGKSMINYSDEKMEKFLISNLLIKTAILVFEFNFEQIHWWYINGTPRLDYNQKKDLISPGILKSYFQYGHFIYMGKFDLDKHKLTIKKNIIASMSLFEIEVLLTSEEIVSNLRSKSNNLEYSKIIEDCLERLAWIRDESSS